MRRFLKIVLILLLVVLLLFAGINQLYLHNDRNCGTMGEVKNDRATVLEVPEHISFCNFGSSHSYYSMDYTVLPQDRVYFNFALPAQTLGYDYRILQAFQDRIEPGAVVTIAVSYFSFFGPEETEGDNFLSKNQRYYSFLPGNYIEQYDLKTDILVNWFPCLQTETPEFFSVLVHPRAVEDEWNLVCDRAGAPEMAQKRYESLLEKARDKNGDRIYNQQELQALYGLIDLTRELGAVPVLVTTPCLAEFRDAVSRNDPELFEDFEAVLQQVLEDTGVVYLDHQADPRFEGRYELFRDTDHLNRRGARLFTKILSEEIRTSPHVQ